MFGYIICNKEKLDKEEISRYQSVYCGLCRTLSERFGQLERMSLNYDMTFLILLLSSLYEAEEKENHFRCAFHPLHKKTSIQNKYTEYAADMTIVLSYYKCLDDWEDERKYAQHYYGKKLKKSYLQVKERYPRQCRAVAEGIAELSRIEKSGNAMPDDAVNAFGRVMAELFVYEEDFWSNSLRSFGYDMGRFIYLMDATMDYKKDQKKQNYNPLFFMGKKPEEMEEPMRLMIGAATRQFEKLPLVQDIHLLRNILYGGVWQQYYAGKSRKESPDD